MYTSLAIVVFISGLSLVLYTYIGYALILRLFPQKKPQHSEAYLPPITIVMPVHNEAGIIENKIANCLQLNYPPEKIQLLVVDDGSTDGTATLVRKYKQVQLLAHKERLGKSAAINTAMRNIDTPLVVFTDATAKIDVQAIRFMVAHFADARVGGVSAEKIISDAGQLSVVSEAESIYWQYESYLKQSESEYYSVLGADGALFAIRTALFRELDADLILDDFAISADVCLQGLQVIYEKRAYAYEPASDNIAAERRRKIRISAGCFQALVRYPELLNAFANPRLFLVYVSHRVLRWTLCPILLPVLFFLNAILAHQTGSGLLMFMWVLQLAFYFAAMVGSFVNQKRLPGWLLIPFYFVFMNLALYRGFWRFVKSSQTVLWEKQYR